MSYSVRVYDADDATAGERSAAEERFREALEAALGDAALVAPVYRAYLHIVATYGEQPDPDRLDGSERELLAQWQAAESAAVSAAFGPNRTMGDAMYEIRLDG